MSENTQQQEAMPSKEEMIKFFTEQIEIKEVQLRLQTVNTELAEAKARELKALEFIGQMTNPQPQGVPHTVTQEDLDNNPELQEAGLKVGDQILISSEDAIRKDKAPTKKTLKKDK